jgi:hypothetical protein
LIFLPVHVNMPIVILILTFDGPPDHAEDHIEVCTCRIGAVADPVAGVGAGGRQAVELLLQERVLVAAFFVIVIVVEVVEVVEVEVVGKLRLLQPALGRPGGDSGAARKPGGGGSFGAAPASDARKSDSALSRKMDQERSEANALRTLDERRAAQAARENNAARPAPAPGTGQPAGGYADDRRAPPQGYGYGRRTGADHRQPERRQRTRSRGRRRDPGPVGGECACQQ